MVARIPIEPAPSTTARFGCQTIRSWIFQACTVAFSTMLKGSSNTANGRSAGGILTMNAGLSL